MVKIWVDSKHNAPDASYIHCRTVDSTIEAIKKAEEENQEIKLIDLGKITGEDLNNGGEQVNVLYWLQENWKPYTVQFHSERSIANRVHN